ncbi:hypothetical protein FGO68_gene14018 [Halteria grandinella]|uniref:Uncharacterized protein n=1 Tax=Halteria grandinella TaxID=5974 RepID=A0A8J8SZJ0_HALGN|nr:hypothetical protein FGO68_gene14018 [Halteria grandinella]
MMLHTTIPQPQITYQSRPRLLKPRFMFFNKFVQRLQILKGLNYLYMKSIHSVSQLIQFKLYLLELLKELLKLHLIKVDPLAISHFALLACIGIQIECELNLWRAHIFAEYLPLLDLRMVQYDLVILLHLRVVQGHVELPVEVFEGRVCADQLALELGEGLALGGGFYHLDFIVIIYYCKDIGA